MNRIFAVLLFFNFLLQVWTNKTWNKASKMARLCRVRTTNQLLSLSRPRSNSIRRCSFRMERVHGKHRRCLYSFGTTYGMGRRRFVDIPRSRQTKTKPVKRVANQFVIVCARRMSSIHSLRPFYHSWSLSRTRGSTYKPPRGVITRSTKNGWVSKRNVSARRSFRWVNFLLSVVVCFIVVQRSRSRKSTPCLIRSSIYFSTNRILHF